MATRLGRQGSERRAYGQPIGLLRLLRARGGQSAPQVRLAAVALLAAACGWPVLSRGCWQRGGACEAWRGAISGKSAAMVGKMVCSSRWLNHARERGIFLTCSRLGLGLRLELGVGVGVWLRCRGRARGLKLILDPVAAELVLARCVLVRVDALLIRVQG